MSREVEGTCTDIVVISSGEEDQSAAELVFTPTKQPPSECSRYIQHSGKSRARG